jgi:hypothetical protein
MLKQLKQHVNALFLFKFGGSNQSFRGFTLIEVAFMVMIVSIIILPVVGAVNANTHNGEPTITETIERQQSIEQGMRSLMQRAINGKIVITDIENPTQQFKTIDANTAGSLDLYDLSNIYATGSTDRQAEEGPFLFKVPIGVQNVNTKDLFQFRWTIKDASFEGTTSTTPDGLKKVGLLLEAFDAKASDTDINGGTVNPLATQYATTLYSETPVVTPMPSTNTEGVIINVDLNQSGCLKRWLKEGSQYGIIQPKKWYYNPFGSIQNDCGENTSNEPTEGLRDWYDTEFSQRTTNPALAYLQRLDIGMQTMQTLDATHTHEMIMPKENPVTFLSKLPSRESSGMMYYDTLGNLPTESYAYSTTARAIKVLENENYTKGTIIHIINTNLDHENQTQNQGNLNGIPLSTKLGVFTESNSMSITTNTPATNNPLPSVNPVVTVITNPVTFITTKTTTLYDGSTNEITTTVTKTDDLLNLARASKNTTNANGQSLTIKHYVIIHKGIDGNTGEYFTAIANETGGKVYYVSDDRSKLEKQLRAIFRDIGEIKKTRKSKTYRHSMR